MSDDTPLFELLIEAIALADAGEEAEAVLDALHDDHLLVIESLGYRQVGRMSKHDGFLHPPTDPKGCDIDGCLPVFAPPPAPQEETPE